MQCGHSISAPEVPGHSLSQHTNTVQVEALSETRKVDNQLNKSYITPKEEEKKHKKVRMREQNYALVLHITGLETRIICLK